MNWQTDSRDPAQGWIIFCGSGGASDCIAARRVDNPRYGQTDPETGLPEPRWLIELGSSKGNGGTFTVHPHELDQLVAGYGQALAEDVELAEAISEDLAAHPELTAAS